MGKDKLIQYLIQKGINITKQDQNLGERKPSLIMVNTKNSSNPSRNDSSNKENIDVK